MISLIVARARNGAIGKDNTIPWRAPEDLAFFQRETTGGAVIMGRNTWDSLPFKPLKGRLNIVISSRGSEAVPGAEHVFGDLDEAVQFARDSGYGRIYGIGGARIYSDLLARADRLLVTEVDLTVDDADAYFPEISSREWRNVGAQLLRDADPRCEVHEFLRRAG
ncbi:dihydrofolate reductase [Rhodobacteraceae bacterium M382]|nr:dihydrofolate reductase [Rhodobacteraceae bacterium M382]